MRKGMPKHGIDNLHWANITIEYQSYRAGTISADQHVWRIQSYWHTGGCVMPRQHLHSNGIISHKHAQSQWQQWQQFNLQTHLECANLYNKNPPAEGLSCDSHDNDVYNAKSTRCCRLSMQHIYFHFIIQGRGDGKYPMCREEVCDSLQPISTFQLCVRPRCLRQKNPQLFTNSNNPHVDLLHVSLTFMQGLWWWMSTILTKMINIVIAILAQWLSSESRLLKLLRKKVSQDWGDYKEGKM